MSARRLTGRRLALLAAAVGAGLVAGCDRGEPGHRERAAEPVDVTVSRAAATATRRSVAATVQAASTAELATRLSAAVEQVRVDIGSRFSKGDTLLVLDDEGVEADIESARAALTRARKTYDRIRSLAEDGAATEQELDDTRARYEKAKAGLRKARAQRQYTVLQAPFDGVVTERRVDSGDLAAPGRPALVLAETTFLEIAAGVPGRFGGRLSAGTEVSVADPETGERAAARVSRASPALDPATRRFRIEARLRREAVHRLGLRPGSYVRLELPGRDSTPWVPADALVREGQLVGVYLVEDDTLRLRWIRPGLRRGGAVEALAGLDPGDAVVRRPPPAAEDGVPAGSVRRAPWSAPSGDARAGAGGPREGTG